MLQLLGLLFTSTLYEPVNTDKSSDKFFATSFEVLAGNPLPPTVVFLYLQTYKDICLIKSINV